MRAKLLLVATMLASLFAGSVQAGIDVDEATFPDAGGDYNNLLLLPVPFVFDLQGGTNLFSGTFGTPGDGATRWPCSWVRSRPSPPFG